MEAGPSTLQYSHQRNLAGQTQGADLIIAHPHVRHIFPLENPPYTQSGSVDFYSQAVPPTGSVSGGRQPRSRKNRPCDRCRRSKSRCTIGPHGPPCSHCSETQKECTFEFAPPPRKEPAKSYDSHKRRGRREVIGSDSHDSETDADLPRKRRAISNNNPPNGMRQESSTASHVPTPIEPQSPPSVSLAMVNDQVPFDRLATADFDPYVLTVVLTDDLLPIRDQYVSGGAVSDGPFVKQISSDPARPTFVIMDPKPDSSRSNRSATLAHLRAFLRAHPLRPSEASLLAQYHSRVHPALPILSNETTLPPQLLSAVICSSLSHSKEMRPLAAPSVSLCADALIVEHDSSLAGVATAVLELGMRPAMGNRASYMLLARTIALAQLLGMHMNPRRWTIPLWEKELRIRLWWTLRIHDAWMSFLNSRPSHIQAHNSTIPLPTVSSVNTASSIYGDVPIDSARAFVASCQLAQLVSHLQVEVCTLGVVVQNDTGRRVKEVTCIGHRVDELYAEWEDRVLQAAPRATGVNSFLILLLGFRCMLKRILIELEYGLGSTFSPTAETLAPFHDCVGFVTRLSEEELDGYYLSYASHVLSSVTSSIIRLSLASEYLPDTSAVDLLKTLIDKLRYCHTTCLWDVAAPAVGRATAVAGRFSDIDEHHAVCAALLGNNEQPGSNVTGREPQVEAGLYSVPEADGQQMLWDLGGTNWDFTDLFA